MKKTYSHVYVDESGDLGRSERSSRYLVVASIVTNDPRKLDKVVRKIWTTKQHKKHSGELHAIDANDSTRFKLLSLIDELDIRIEVSVLDKVSFPGNLHHKYYEMLALHVSANQGAKVIVVDKRDTIKKREEVLKQLRLKARFKNVEFADSRTVRQLQAIDFICWSIFQSQENNSQQYLEAIKTKIKESLPF